MSGPWLYDRVKDTSTTTGTGTLTLANSAPTGFRTFGSVLSNSDTVYYCIAHQSAAEWETGIGTYTTSGTTLARTTVLSSSNSGSAVNFSAGTKDVFVTPMAATFGNRLPEISITGAVTATIDRVHVCSGTSADYTVTLPAASGNYGRRLWFRMAPIASLSKLVTLDGNASETIDGATTRVMWAGETCTLWCDGSNWFKIAGKSIQMSAGLYRNTSAHNIANSTPDQVLLNTTLTDPTGFMAVPASNRIVLPRASRWLLIGTVSYGAMSANSGNTQSKLYINGTQVRAMTIAALSGGYVAPQCCHIYDGAAGDLVTLYAYQTTGGTQALYVSAPAENILTVLEQPLW